MMNFQKHSIELADIMADHEMVGVFKETGKLKPCDEMSCYECEFDGWTHCSDALVGWMFREVRE